MERFTAYVRGVLRIEIHCDHPERFVNLCGKQGILVWNIEIIENGYQMNIYLRDFYALRLIRRKTGGRIKILKRTGLVFLKKVFVQKLFFIIGLLIYVWLLLYSENYVWQIQYDGNLCVTDEQLDDFLESNGIYPLMKKNKVPIALLELKIREEFPQITWASIKFDGNVLSFSIKENEVEVVELFANEQGSLIAPEDGIVRYIIVRKGTPKCKVGQKVTKNDILVDGRVDITGDDGSVVRSIYLEADADIILETELDYYDQLSQKYIEKEYTGRIKKDYTLKLGDYLYTTEGKASFLYEETWQNQEQLSTIQKRYLPFWICKKEKREYQLWVKEYDEKAAKIILEQNLNEFIESLEIKGVQIIEKDVKMDKDGSFYRAVGKLVLHYPVKTKVNTWESMEFE